MSEGDVNWTGTSEEMAREIVSRSETYLQAQLQAAVAADQRAMALVGLFIATATAATGGAFAFWQTTGDTRLLAAGLVSASLLLIAAAFCMWAAKPCNFYFPGAEPKNWIPIRHGSLVTALGGEAENYQLSIEDNKKVLEANEAALRKGVWAALMSPLIAALVWIILGATSISYPTPSAGACPPVQQQSYSDGL